MEQLPAQPIRTAPAREMPRERTWDHTKEDLYFHKERTAPPEGKPVTEKPNRKDFRPQSAGKAAFEPIYNQKSPFQAKQKEFFGVAPQSYQRTFDRPPRVERHVFGDTTIEKKVRANHGQLSFHPLGRVESAKVLRVNAPGATDVLDLQFQSQSPGLSKPSELRNRDHNSRVDMGEEKHLQYKAKPLDDPFHDKTHQAARAKDQMFSDIFHSKTAQEVRDLPDRSKGRYRQPQDTVPEQDGAQYELSGGHVKQRRQVIDSYGNPLLSYDKGQPSDPKYYNKLTVKGIKEAVLQSKANRPLEPEVPDTRFRAFKHKGSGPIPPRETQFDLKGVASDQDYVALKKQLALDGIQFLDVDIKEDMCSQMRTGEADLRVRSHGPRDDVRLKNKLGKMGIQATEHHPKNKKTTFKDEFAGKWNSELLEGKDQALMAKYARADAKGKRQVEMSSHAQLFGTVGYR